MAESANPDMPFSRMIWDLKYRLKASDGTPREHDLDDTWRRVAAAAAEPEVEADRPHWERAFFAAMQDLAFLPAGRIIAGAGTDRNVTLFNCFVMGTIGDDMTSIFDNLKEAGLTMRAGGGIGHDFSTLRPRGARVHGVGADASGPVSFMDMWNTMCGTIMSAGGRRGAMMATLACDHPDIEDFVAAKSEPGRLSNFNLSVLVSDAFIEAVKADGAWPLRFAGETYRTVRARELWQKIMRATYDYAEPGVIFIDRVNAQNNLAYCETIHATNPCGEQPLPPYGACLLGSVNLARLVDAPFGDGAALDETRLRAHVRTAVRLLDNIIDVSRYPLEAQRSEALSKRRIGLGVTGLADALIMCRAHYADDDARRLAGRWMALVQREAYLASAELAGEKGAFPLYDSEAFLAAPGVQRLDDDVRARIAENGVRNALLTSIAPTGTISLLAGNVSSGVEPVFDFTYSRRIRRDDGGVREERVEDYALGLFRTHYGADADLPDYFVSARDLSPRDHLAMQGVLQDHVDSSISKTINCPGDISFEAFEQVYLDAYEMGLKGCTTYRPNAIRGAVLVSGEGDGDAGEAGAGTDTSAERASAPARDRDGCEQAAGSGMQERNKGLVPRADQAAGGKSEIVYMADPLERDAVLAGATYKIKWPDSDHAFYITINDVVQDGRRRPFEIFINTKNLEHYAWVVALTRMISAVFRRGGDVSFVVEELKAVFDPRGGQWHLGRYVPSLIAAIGEVVEQHMVDIGFIPPPGRERGDTTATVRPRSEARARYCPRCHAAALVPQEGCLVCRLCGYSKCG